MAAQFDRRGALVAAGVGALGLTAFRSQSVLASHSSGAGVVAGGTIAGTGGDVTFSVFGSKIEYTDGHPIAFFCALAWYDPVGLDGGPVTLSLVQVASYGPGETDDTRILAGTVAVNGEGEVPFSLTLVDAGLIGEAVDSVHLTVGADVAIEGATPVAASDFAYEASGELTAGDVQIITGTF